MKRWKTAKAAWSSCVSGSDCSDSGSRAPTSMLTGSSAEAAWARARCFSRPRRRLMKRSRSP
eukprot:1126839-Alexandrium_andersonii.AAC.1